MTREIRTEPLTASAFAEFGDVLEARGSPDKIINQGNCGRYNDLALMEMLPGGRTGISIFDAKPRSLPYVCDMLERHPFGAQAFIPMHSNPYLVIVAPSAGGKPATPRAFVAGPGQGVNYHRETWHGVLTPLAEPGLFAVIDWIGRESNLEEHWLDEPVTIVEG